MKLDGIQGVEVDLATGAVAINATAPLDRAAVAGAIDEAGFDLAA
jgi:copper chaperone CopZ